MSKSISGPGLVISEAHTELEIWFFYNLLWRNVRRSLYGMYLNYLMNFREIGRPLWIRFDRLALHIFCIFAVRERLPLRICRR